MKKFSEQILQNLPSISNYSELHDKRIISEINRYTRNGKSLQSIVETKNFLTLIKKAEELIEEQQELEFRMNPPVYLTKFKERTGIFSIIGRSNWPLSNGKRKSISVYVGKYDDFSKGITDPEAMKIAKEKMIIAIREKFPMK